MTQIDNAPYVRKWWVSGRSPVCDVVYLVSRTSLTRLKKFSASQASMRASYSVRLEPENNLLVVTLLGFFSVDDMTSLRTDLLSGIESLGCRPGQHLALHDIRNCKIQSQEVVNALRSMSDKEHVVARRLAVVAGNSLMRMQLKRILVRRDSRVFEDLALARHWLLTQPNAPNQTKALANDKHEDLHTRLV